MKALLTLMLLVLNFSCSDLDQLQNLSLYKEVPPPANVKREQGVNKEYVKKCKQNRGQKPLECHFYGIWSSSLCKREGESYVRIQLEIDFETMAIVKIKYRNSDCEVSQANPYKVRLYKLGEPVNSFENTYHIDIHDDHTKESPITRFDIVKIEDGKLTFGAKYHESHDGTSEMKRPVQLDANEFFQLIWVL